MRYLSSGAAVSHGPVSPSPLPAWQWLSMIMELAPHGRAISCIVNDRTGRNSGHRPARRELDRATRPRGKERRSLNALRPIRDWHVVMPLISRRFDDRVWSTFVAQTFGVTGGRRSGDIIDVNPCV